MSEGETDSGDVVDGDRVRILHGDAFDELAGLPENAVHAVVTDPPYNYEGGFMGEAWDDIGTPREFQEWTEAWVREARRVLKPGGHVLAFGSTQSYHRVAAGVEDAGFTVRDTLTWHYGNGFPKGLDVGKAIDDKKGAEREVVGESPHSANRTDREGVAYNAAKDGTLTNEGRRKITAPSTAEAKRWDGWKTQLKPATEFVVLARSPLAEDTVAENVLEHGTGALNIDGCRIDVDGTRPAHKLKERENPGNALSGSVDQSLDSGTSAGETDKGRYPANLALDETAAEQLDAQSGDLPGGTVDFSESVDNNNQTIYGAFSGGENRTESYQYDDDGGASRFFYTSKASQSERTHGGRIENSHPTVKPVDLVRWLVRLVSAEGQTVLDPFLGSGTTAVACLHEYRECIGIEADADSVETARDRVRVTRERNATEPGERLTDYMTATDGGEED